MNTYLISDDSVIRDKFALIYAVKKYNSFTGNWTVISPFYFKEEDAIKYVESQIGKRKFKNTMDFMWINRKGDQYIIEDHKVM